MECEMDSFVFFFSFVLGVCGSNAARILGVVPMRAKSHYNFHEALFRSLAAAGHNVTVVSPFTPVESIENLTTIWLSTNDDDDDEAKHRNPFSRVASSNIDTRSLYERLMKIALTDCRNIWQMPYIQNLLNSPEKHVDVIMFELFFGYECYLPIAENLRIPVIGTSSSASNLYLDAVAAAPRNPAVLPHELAGYGTKMTFFERLCNVFLYARRYVVEKRFVEPLTGDYLRTYHSTFGLTDKRISLVFANYHPAVFTRATGPNLVNVAGVHMEMGAKRSLTNDMRKFIDDAAQGVILFSLGSIASTSALSAEAKVAFKEAFATIPQRVIWKFDENISDLPQNVMLSKWFPQNEILAHPKVVAFMTHCGLMSTYEAIYHGKPLIMIPIFADQPSIAARLRELTVGLYLNVKHANKEKIVELIDEIVNNTMYADHMRRLSRIVRDVPTNASIAIDYWTNYVLKHNGAAALRTVAVDMQPYRYSLLDVIGFTIVILLAILWTMILLRRACHAIKNYSSRKLYNAKEMKKQIVN